MFVNQRSYLLSFLLLTILCVSTISPSMNGNPTSRIMENPSPISLSQTLPTTSLESSIVYDSESDRIIRYGGWSSLTTSPGHSEVLEYLDETWAFDLNANEWTNMSPSSNPGPKAGSAAAYDSQSDRMIIYGGQISETSSTPEELYSSDTWAYDFNSNLWTNMSPAQSPGLRFSAAMAYDSESDIIVLFGGINYPSLNGYHIQQTWAYDFDTNTWTDLEPEIQPIGRHLTGMVYDVESDRIIMFGGYVSSAVDESSGETWAFDYNTNTWELMEPERSPDARFYGSLSYDNESDRTIMYGGAYDFSNNAVLGDTWQYNYNSDEWLRLEPNPHPPARWRHVMVYDIESNTHVLCGGSFGDIFGGEARTDSCWSYIFDEDQWTNLDGNFNPSAPGPPENPMLIYDGYTAYLSWEPPINDTGYAITGYRIYRGVESGVYTLLTETDNVLIYPDNDVIAGYTYYYVVSAINPVGEGLQSEEFTLSNPAPFPVLEVTIGGIVVLFVCILIISRIRRRAPPVLSE